MKSYSELHAFATNLSKMYHLTIFRVDRKLKSVSLIPYLGGIIPSSCFYYLIETFGMNFYITDNTLRLYCE